MPGKVVAQSTTDRVAAELRRRILDGRLPEGSSLRQERLAAALGASRVPLREALRKLEAEGLLSSELHKGAVVSSLSLPELEELFAIRVRLETWLFELAIPRMDEADHARAEALIDEAARTGTVENWGELNWSFHEALYRASGSTIALRLLRTVHDNALRYVNLQLQVSRDIERELSDHHAMLAYARLRDTRRGVEALRWHLDRVCRNLVASISAARGGPAPDPAPGAPARRDEPFPLGTKRMTP